MCMDKNIYDYILTIIWCEFVSKKNVKFITLHYVELRGTTKLKEDANLLLVTPILFFVFSFNKVD